MEWARKLVGINQPTKSRVKMKSPPDRSPPANTTVGSLGTKKIRKLGTPSRSRSGSNSRSALSPLSDILKGASAYRRCETQANSAFNSPTAAIKPKSSLKKRSIVPKSPSTPTVGRKSPKSPRTPKGRSPRSPRTPKSAASIAQSEGSFTAWWEESDSVIEDRVAMMRKSCGGSRKNVTFMCPLTRSPSPARPQYDSEQKRLSFSLSVSPDTVHKDITPVKIVAVSPDAERAVSETPSDVSLPPQTPERSPVKVPNPKDEELTRRINLIMDENTVPMIRHKLDQLNVEYPKKGPRNRKRELAELYARSAATVHQPSVAPTPPKRLSITRRSIRDSPAAADNLSRLVRDHYKEGTLASLPATTLSTFVDNLGYKTAKDKYVLISMIRTILSDR